jgi:hypothetical protein
MTLAVYGGRTHTSRTNIDALERLLPSTLRQRLTFELIQDPYATDPETVMLDGRRISGKSIGEIVDAIYVRHAATRGN